ncbi:MAG: ribosome small subunit-dependent GTPase A [Myxococcota bacterium]
MSTRQGLVMRSTAGFVDARLDDGTTVQCRMRGRLKQGPKRTDLCVIGDHVIVEETPDAWAVSEVLPRSTRFSRRQPGRGAPKEDVVVANLDQLLITFSYGEPLFNPRLLDRFLVIAEHQGVDPVIVMNKADLAGPKDRDWQPVYDDIGYRTLTVSAEREEGLAALEETLADKISVFVGPSGVGKSSLLNGLLPNLELEVATVSAHHGKGRHTTRVASLYPLSSGGFLADTPGIRELGAWALPHDALDRCFPEFAPYRSKCAFRGCSHTHEPGCAVLEAVERGEIDANRYDSYVRLRQDAER